MDRLEGAVTVVDEVHGFQYFDERDLLGFVDGTENPDGAAAREAAVIVGDEDAEFAGGSYVIVQKYLHDLTAWNAMSVEEQERAIGRTQAVQRRAPRRREAWRLPRRAQHDRRRRRHASARSCATTWRSARSATGEFGTYFIGYAAHPDVIERMLAQHVHRRSARQPRPGPRLLDRGHGQPVLRAAADLLDDLPPAPAAVTPTAAPPSDTSLAIGSLRR